MIKVKSKANGCEYTISEAEYEKYHASWELIPEEKTYAEMKEILTALEIPFKKNASKETLKELLGEV